MAIILSSFFFRTHMAGISPDSSLHRTNWTPCEPPWRFVSTSEGGTARPRSSLEINRGPSTAIVGLTALHHLLDQQLSSTRDSLPLAAVFEPPHTDICPCLNLIMRPVARYTNLKRAMLTTARTILGQHPSSDGTALQSLAPRTTSSSSEAHCTMSRPFQIGCVISCTLSLEGCACVWTDIVCLAGLVSALRMFPSCSLFLLHQRHPENPYNLSSEWHTASSLRGSRSSSIRCP